MACPVASLHIPIFLFFFLFPLSLSISSTASSHLTSSSLSHPEIPKVMYVLPKPQPSAQLDSKAYNGIGKVKRSLSYGAYNTSTSKGDGGGGGRENSSEDNQRIVHKLHDGKTGGITRLPVSKAWDVVFDPDHIDKLQEGDEVSVTLTTSLKTEDVQYYQIRLMATDDHWVASVDPSLVEIFPSTNGNISVVSGKDYSSFSANFTIKGVFVGFAKIRAVIEAKEGTGIDEGPLTLWNVTSANFLKVSVIRKNSWMDHAFTVSIAVLVSVLFVNFGAALDWDVLKETLRRPIGPSIGFVTQFLFMPIVSYLLGLMLFDDASMKLGLFFTGCSPGGGASNIWTFALGGNLPLSISMTTISTFASFGMMPFWLFTLGATIFNSADLSVPYSKIATFAIALVVPLALGFLVQRKWPKAATFLVRHILKPLCGFLLIFIVVFAIATNLYIFHLFSWKIILCGMGLPWLGFACGAIASRLFSLPSPDVLAIAIETGVQNTGIAIFMLRFTLGQPLADLTTVIPVSIAVMTPVPLALLWVYKVATGKIRVVPRCNSGGEELGAERPLRESTVDTINGTMMKM